MFENKKGKDGQKKEIKRRRPSFKGEGNFYLIDVHGVVIFIAEVGLVNEDGLGVKSRAAAGASRRLRERVVTTGDALSVLHPGTFLGGSELLKFLIVGASK